jgi:hypothetical protein
MPKASVYDVNPIDHRILEAAQRLADDVVQPAIENMAAALGADWEERPSVVAAALSETLYRLVLREDTTRWLAVVAEQERDSDGEKVAGVVETRDAIGRLAGYSRTGIERRLGLVGRVRRGRPRSQSQDGWTPREMADAVIVARVQRLANEDLVTKETQS